MFFLLLRKYLSLSSYLFPKMAPVLTESIPTQTFPSSRKSAPTSIFPDGIKTSGQHPPLYDQLKSFEEFPSEIGGPTVWNADDYRNSPERWTHHLSEDEVSELGNAADDFKAAGIPLTGISKVFRVFCRRCWTVTTHTSSG